MLDNSDWTHGMTIKDEGVFGYKYWPYKFLTWCSWFSHSEDSTDGAEHTIFGVLDGPIPYDTLGCNGSSANPVYFFW